MSPERETCDALEILAALYRYPEMKSDVAKFQRRFELGADLFAARERAGLSQKELADLIGTTERLIDVIETANYEEILLDLIRKMAAALGLRLKVSVESVDETVSETAAPLETAGA